MHRNKPRYFILFLGLAFSILLLILFSLPGAARTSIEVSTHETATSTPTISLSFSSVANNVDSSTAYPSTAGNTLSPTSAVQDSPSYEPTAVFYFPLLSKDLIVPTPTPTQTPAPPQTKLYCDGISNSRNIPDDDPNGIDDFITIPDGRLAYSLTLYLNISHTWVGDLVVTLTHQDTGDKITEA